MVKSILKRLLTPLIRNLKPCTSCREGFPTYPRIADEQCRSEIDLIYCELIAGHAGKHRGLNSQTFQYWFWSQERQPRTKNEEVKDGVLYYNVSEYWQTIFPENV